MSKTKHITYVFRRPRCPLICSIDGYLVPGRTLRAFERCLARFDLSNLKEFTMADANGESWMLLPDKMV